jgi:hypothetical protein
LHLSLRPSLPPTVLASLADLVRSMNCYYSNLIEGHDTHPIDIERALKNDHSEDPKRRDLQVEAKAHIHVQRRIDQGGLRGGRAFTAEGICEVHRRFCAALPEDLLWAEEPSTKERVRVVRSELRRRDIKVGSHIASAPVRCPGFSAGSNSSTARWARRSRSLRMLPRTIGFCGCIRFSMAMAALPG